MKVLIILLVIAVLLFVGLMVWGSGKDKEQARQDDSTTKANRFNDSGHHSILDAFNGVFAPFSPTLKPSSMSPALTVFDLAARPSTTIVISPDSKHKFRQAKFLIQPIKTCAHIKYEAPDSNPDLKVQDSNKDTDTSKRPTEFTLTILKGGGKLTVERKDPLTASPCKVQLKQ